MTTRIYLLRHGQTEWTISGRHTGVTDVALTARGEDEARHIKTMLGGGTFQRVFSSPRQRAVRTCQLAGLGRDLTVIDDLREWDYGDYEGLLAHEINERHPGWNVFVHGCPGGETPDQAAARADRVLALAREIDGTVAFFSHGHFTRVLAARWAGLPLAHAGALGSATGSMSVLDYNGNGSKPVIALWNRTWASS